MLKSIKERIFPFIIALSALAVSGSAAFYSVSGLSKLFAGATFAVIIMAASLEISKLVIASLLYQYRKSLPFLLKSYLTIACVVLILITSMGIYGFLSAAYQETAALAGNVDAQIALIETKRDNIKEQVIVYTEEKTSINESITGLRNGLSNNVIQYTDTLGNVITTQSSSTRKALTKQLDQIIERQTVVNTKLDELNTQLFDYETEIVEVSNAANISGELGPLKYLAGLTGIPMDKIINVLLLVIIFVFDPLAIALVVAANFAFEKIGGKRKEDKDEFKIIHEIEKEVIKEVPVEVEVEKIVEKEVIKEVPVEVIKEIEVEKIVEKKVPIEVVVEKEVIKEVIKEVPVEVIREVEVEKEGYATAGLVQPELSNEEKKYDLDGDGVLNENEQEMMLITKENEIINGDYSNWQKEKYKRQRHNRELALKDEIFKKFDFIIDIQKEKELHSNHKNEIGSDYYPVEGDIGFPPWLRLKYQNLKISRRNDGDDDLTITYS